METVVKDNGVLCKDIDFKFTSQEITSRYKKKLSEIAPKVEISGFRKGKVPVRLVERKFKNDVLAELTDDLLKESFDHLTKNFNTIGNLKLNTKNEVVTLDQEYLISLTTSIMPEEGIPAYKGLKYDQPEIVVSEEDVLGELEKLSSQGQSLQDVTDDSAIQESDMATINVTFKNAQDAEVHSVSAVPTPADQLLLSGCNVDEEQKKILINRKIGEVIFLSVVANDSFSVEDYRGKRLSVIINVTGIKRLAKAELNDEFAQKYGLKDLEDLKARIKESLIQAKQQDLNQDKKEKLLDQLAASANFLIPEKYLESVIRSEKRNALKHGQNEHVHDENCDHDHDHEEHVHDENCDHDYDEDEDYDDDHRIHVHNEDCDHDHDDDDDENEDLSSVEVNEDKIRRDVTREIILQHIIKEEKLQASQADIQEYILSVSRQYSIDPSKLVKGLDQQTLNQISAAIVSSKALDIIANSTVPNDK